MPLNPKNFRKSFWHDSIWNIFLNKIDLQINRINKGPLIEFYLLLRSKEESSHSKPAVTPSHVEVQPEPLVPSSIDFHSRIYRLQVQVHDLDNHQRSSRQKCHLKSLSLGRQILLFHMLPPCIGWYGYHNILDKHGLFGNIIGGNIIVIGATDSVVQVLMQEESKLTMNIPKYGKLFLRKVLI